MKYFLSSTIIIIAAFFSTGCSTPKPPALKQADQVYKNKVASAKADFKESREELLEKEGLSEAQARAYIKSTIFYNEGFDGEPVLNVWGDYFYQKGTLSGLAKRKIDNLVQEGRISREEYDHNMRVGRFKVAYEALEYTRDSKIKAASRDLEYEYRRHGREKAIEGILRRR